MVFCFAHMVLFCVYNVFGGCRVMSKCKGEGYVMRMVAWVEGRKSAYTPSIRPYTSEYTAVFSEVYGKNTSPILGVY